MIYQAGQGVKRVWRILGALGRDAFGNVLPMAAIGMVVSAMLIGGGIDMGRAYLAKNRLQAACDAAVLAGRRAVTTSAFDAAAQAQASTYFATNFDDGQLGTRNTAFSATGADRGNTITGTASARLDATLTRIMGNDHFDLAVTCVASMGVGNSDVVMVLDTTGSMDWALSGSTQTRIEALRAAMKNFYTTLHTATAGSSARIRYGFVPYSSSVNVGRLLYNLDPAYLVDSHTIQSRAPVFVTEDRQIFDHWGDPHASTGTPDTGNFNEDSYVLNSTTAYSSRDLCDAALPAATAWTNEGSPSTGTGTSVNGAGQQVATTTVTQRQQRTAYACIRSGGNRYIYRRTEYRDYYTYSHSTSDPVYRTETVTRFDRWEFKPVAYDTSTYKTFAAATTNTGSSGAAQSSTWAGCIEERSSTPAATFSYSALSGISPTAADLDIDSAPGVSDGTKWAPMWPEVAYYRTTSRGSMTSTSPSAYGAHADSYCPKPARLLAAMTQGEFNAYTDALDPQGATYHDIGMIWGARLASPDGIFAANVTEAPTNGGNVSRHIVFMTDGEMSTNYDIQTTYGIEYHDRRVTADGYTDSDARHNSRFRAVCEAAKAKGIRVWVIAFSSTLTTDLQACASSGSAYTASSAAQLNFAFQEIAKQVGELRVVQ